jgi:hypothetical protein
MTSTLIHGLNHIAINNLKNYLENIKDDSKTNILYPAMIVNNTPIKTNKLSPYITYDINNSHINVGYYNDLNKNKIVHKSIIKYFYNKIVDKWLYGKLNSLLGFIEIINNKPSIIKSIKNYKNSTKSEDTEIKINFLVNTMITKNMVKNVIEKIITKYNNINWVNIIKYKTLFIDKFNNYLKTKLEEIIDI